MRDAGRQAAAGGVRLRLGRREDAPGLARLFRRSVAELGPRHYSPDQLRVWAASDIGARMARLCSDGRLVLLAVDGRDQPLAFADLEADGHIDHLFAAPEAAGRGIATRLVAALEAAARRRDLAGLHVEASEAARGLFTRRGFITLERCDLVIAGVPIHNYAMDKRLG